MKVRVLSDFVDGNRKFKTGRVVQVTPKKAVDFIAAKLVTDELETPKSKDKKS